ncbi:MAG: hypothetical protein K0R21_1478 [Anaerocolumna sp.]|jgi:hypothetical protein|nr:hypothetical protein [Anaerocolumna sp.]
MRKEGEWLKENTSKERIAINRFFQPIYLWQYRR